MQINTKGFLLIIQSNYELIRIRVLELLYSVWDKNIPEVKTVQTVIINVESYVTGFDQ